MKNSCLVLLLFISTADYAQKGPVGVFDASEDIGNPMKAGSAKYDPVQGKYIIRGAGNNIWFNRDEFQFVYKKIIGDFILTADFKFTGKKGNNHRKIGWMARQSLDESSSSMNAVVHGDGLTVLQWRPSKGDFMRDPQDEIFFPEKYFETIQFQRSGKTMSMRIANSGQPLKLVGSHDMPDLPSELFAGLFLCSHDSSVVEEAVVWNVRIESANAQQERLDENNADSSAAEPRSAFIEITASARKTDKKNN